MTVLRRAGVPVVWQEPYGESGGPLTWRPIVPHPERDVAFKDDIALATCAFGHECRLSGTVHEVAADGTVTPSLVCPIPGCTDHTCVRLEGWPP